MVAYLALEMIRGSAEGFVREQSVVGTGKNII
jgi:hypothetical protein